ncbi:MAG: agmatine deiminase family protein [Verrucomicrobiales bacterium]|nr:agmatine deiminase family protein [Verrucomicrobiales bacterium]
MQNSATLFFSRNSDLRIPGEFEQQEAIVFGCGQLVRHYPQTFVDFVTLSHERVRLYGIISPGLERLARILLATSGLPADAVSFIPRQTSSMWVRDFSPIGALNRNGERIFLSFNQEHMRNRDDIGATELFESQFHGDFRKVELNLEGGNLLSNGAGLLLSSKTIPMQNQLRGDHNRIAEILDREAGGAQWAAVSPLQGERTGHIDLMATFLSPRLLIVGESDPADHPGNAGILNSMAGSIHGLETAAGKIQVERIPMPFSGDTHFRSYCNVLFANGLLIVPTYPNINPRLDQEVLARFAALLPDWHVVGLDCEEISKKGGSLHCMTMNLPQDLSVIARSRSGIDGTSVQAKETLPL